MKFERAEIATILAALQLYRESGYGNPDMYRWISQRILSVATWSFTIDPLEDDGIEALMNRFRDDGEYPS
ncbi:hypothetical protein [Luteolibacter luteus]|uniref:Uncharacterized protein n=1 Tax=Luteolibacter luteus TaxID=2728835 RepID=A0A858RL14_9BACT|nr:hypothetical protein [Luteolibacter luteus]QJE97291.1 hypothetical protein HHL09_16340 [Luteolibacter luteus]